MSESGYSFRPVAVQGIPKKPVHVPKSIGIMDVTLDKLTSSGDNIVAAGVLLIQKANAAALLKKQEAMSMGAPDRTEMRNKSYDVCFNDHISNMSLLQIAANKIQDYNEAAALIKRNGYEIEKEHAPLTRNLISIKAKKNSEGTIIASVKAPNTRNKYSIDWEYTYDNGLSWIPSHSTAICKRTISGLESLKKIKVRARFIIGNGLPTDWLLSNSINI